MGTAIGIDCCFERDDAFLKRVDNNLRRPRPEPPPAQVLAEGPPDTTGALLAPTSVRSLPGVGSSKTENANLAAVASTAQQAAQGHEDVDVGPKPGVEAVAKAEVDDSIRGRSMDSAAEFDRELLSAHLLDGSVRRGFGLQEACAAWDTLETRLQEQREPAAAPEYFKSIEPIPYEMAPGPKVPQIVNYWKDHNAQMEAAYVLPRNALDHVYDESDARRF